MMRRVEYGKREEMSRGDELEKACRSNLSIWRDVLLCSLYTTCINILKTYTYKCLTILDIVFLCISLLSLYLLEYSSSKRCSAVFNWAYDYFCRLKEVLSAKADF